MFATGGCHGRRCHSADCVAGADGGETLGVMYVLQCAGRWFAGLLEAFDDALVALDDDDAYVNSC